MTVLAKHTKLIILCLYSGLAGPWNRGIIAHQTPHFRRPPKHVNNKGLLVFAQTFCTACFISLENLQIHSKTYVFSNTFDGFRPKYTFRGCLSKYRRTFIVYMFRRPPEVWSLMSDNTLISGTGKVGMQRNWYIYISCHHNSVHENLIWTMQAWGPAYPSPQPVLGRSAPPGAEDLQISRRLSLS